MFTEKSFVLKPSEAEKKWYVIDAADKVVGRLATEVANILRGKNNPKYTPHTDSGDYVIILNADKVKFTGNKWDQKLYRKHTGFVGGLKSRTARQQLERKPDFIVMNAVKGMLPKNSLGRQQLTKLRVFAGETHTHEAQQPVEYKF